jgi:hypothetical protein
VHQRLNNGRHEGFCALRQALRRGPLQEVEDPAEVVVVMVVVLQVVAEKRLIVLLEDARTTACGALEAKTLKTQR